MADLDNFEFVKFDGPLLAATTVTWTQQLQANSANLIVSAYQIRLGWVSERLKGKPEDGSYAYAIVEKATGCAVAIVEVVFREQAAKWLKLLDLTLSPELDLSSGTQAVEISTFSAIYATAVIGTVALTVEQHKTNVIKLYGRSENLLAFFKGIAGYIQTRLPAYVGVSIQGRWLVFEGREE